MLIFTKVTAYVPVAGSPGRDALWSHTATLQLFGVSEVKLSGTIDSSEFVLKGALLRDAEEQALLLAVDGELSIDELVLTAGTFSLRALARRARGRHAHGRDFQRE